MPKARIDKIRAKRIARKLAKYDLMKGGRKLVMESSHITDNVWYRALAGSQLEISNAEKLEQFLGINSPQTA